MKLEGKKVAVVGLARSGIAAAKLCAKLGAKVYISDFASADALSAPLNELKGILSGVETGGNTVEFLSKADLIVVSPGVPLAAPTLVEMKSRGAELIPEVELASSQIHCPIIGITGSNGKTTTTMLTGLMLEKSGLSVFVGGNIGTALSELPLSGKKADVAVVELSSFQLEAVSTLRVKAAALLNITVDHMDRYPDFDSYANAKMRLLESVKEGGVAVLNGDDPETDKRCRAIEIPARWFGMNNGPDASIEEGRLQIDNWAFSLDEFDLVGRHNLENAMAAALLAKSCGATRDGIQAALDQFEAIPHRLEPVREYNGVRIYNDSKSTAPSSVATALMAFENPVVLLMGGRDKGSDFSELAKPLSKRTKGVFTFGEAGQKIASQLSPFVPATFAGKMYQAAGAGLAECVANDVLLFSPGCASFDAFRNYEHRGDSFKEWAREL